MANPRQRRKAKSSAHKAISHSKRAKRLQKKMPAIRGPKALQDAWDPSRTLRQNYLALGLQHDLNPISSGGSEVNISRVANQSNAERAHPTVSSSAVDDARSSSSDGPAVTSTLPKGFGRIIRDSSGDIIRVELPSDEVEDDSKRQVEIESPVVATDLDLRVWAHRLEPSRRLGPGSNGDTIVQDLENLAASTTVRERHTSSGERWYLERLVKKYGDDLHKMACDRRFNPQQRTANELRRAITKAGGFAVLRDGTDSKISG